jgi:RNA polymerase sigma-70 factor (ECF subfamily)
MSEAIDRKHIAEDVRKALLSLRTEWRQILHFYYWENRTYEEIAEIMGKPINTIKVWMSRAKQQLEKELQPI